MRARGRPGRLRRGNRSHHDISGGGAAVAIAASDATITDADSTKGIDDGHDHQSPGRRRGSARGQHVGYFAGFHYSGGVLDDHRARPTWPTIAGWKPEDRQSQQHGFLAPTGNRTIEVVVNDGVTNSAGDRHGRGRQRAGRLLDHRRRQPDRRQRSNLDPVHVRRRAGRARPTTTASPAAAAERP